MHYQLTTSRADRGDRLEGLEQAGTQPSGGYRAQGNILCRAGRFAHKVTWIGYFVGNRYSLHKMFSCAQNVPLHAVLRNAPYAGPLIRGSMGE